MDEGKKKEKAEKLINEAIKQRGYMYPEWEFVCRSDPDFFENYNNLYVSAMGKGTVLPIKIRELIALGILAYKGVPTDVLEAHIKRAMQNGATVEELLEGIETTIAPGGAPTFHNGIKALLNIIQKDQKK
jgi:alkylhydroperoxidase/carboxymuconolactone decarboxylase family protein YurZ